MGSSHPLDPLREEEVVVATRAVREGTASSEGLIRFNVIDVVEPPKESLIEYENGGPAPPRVIAVTYQLPREGRSFCAKVLTDGGGPERILERRELGSHQPLLTPDDCLLAEEIVKRDPKVKAILMEDRYRADASSLQCDPWSIHCTGSEPFDTSKRLVQTFLYLRASEYDNAYAKPLDFLPVVDLNAGEVVHIHREESAGKSKIPSQPYNYHPSLLSGNRVPGSLSSVRENALKPLEIVQPDGVSFKVKGHEVAWDKWTLRLGFNHREGLVLHNVKFAGELVLWRLSLVEMAVPYGDPKEPFQRKCAFDVGDYGLGFCANSLGLGCDCLGEIHYLDATLSDSKGEPYTVKKVVCLHEEDDGLLWKHVEYRTGHNQSRRSRKLVISFIVTVVNYEYCVYYYLKQDGSIAMEIKLTGMLSTNYTDARPDHGTLVAPSVNAQVHQHMFCARLDMAVGGHKNSVAEVDVKALPLDESTNPFGNAFGAAATLLETEREGQREVEPSLARTWRIFNPSKVNPVSHKPIGYKLVCQAQPLLLTHPSSAVSRRGAFATKSLWVTRHTDGQFFPAGEYTVQSKGQGEGLPEWTKDGGKSIVDTDIVLFHSFGVCHIPRPEDFPVMPCESTGFMLVPDSFLSCNPGIDLPEDRSTMSKCCSGGPPPSR
ncbi:copper amine oxidase [Chloropicon primus]|uniref:Amine oxidase n=1 Tax=Chloropicon primus TaxID=1764295 RepID=A0A5B8MIR9_9CHLO|nr:copper amine oxidase [Chloropicon primus]|eukprot:QDZ20279.1 copper amine oxidase [Chloropicon primus]